MLKKLTILFSILLCLTACSFSEKKTPTVTEFEEFINDNEYIEVIELIPEELVQYFNWHDITHGLNIREYPIIENNKHIDTITIVKIDPKQNEFSIHQNPKNPKTITEWQEELNSDIIINGGYFNENYKPSGGLIIGNQSYGAMTHTGKNGYTGMIIINDGKIELRYLPEKNYNDSESIDYAIQTFPTIITPGSNKGLEKDSYKKARRSIIAQDHDENILLIVTDKATFSLYEIMNFLIKNNLNIDIAFNLDGGPSSGVIINKENFEYLKESSIIPNVISVKTK